LTATTKAPQELAERWVAKALPNRVVLARNAKTGEVLWNPAGEGFGTRRVLATYSGSDLFMATREYDTQQESDELPN
jgi:hypothetical protein